MFNDVQKSLLPLAIIPSAIICIIFYRYGKKGIFMDGETLEKRLFWCYPLISSLLLGEFFFQAIPNSTGNTSFISAFIVLGFFLVFCAQKFSRVWHDNPYYVSPESSYMEIHNAIDLRKMELVEYHHYNLADEDVSNDGITLKDEITELKRRRFIARLTFLIMCIMCVLEGFFLLHSTWDPWIVIAFFVLDKLMESCIIAIGGLHAFLHAPTERQYNWYILLAGIWCICVCCSTIPVLVGMSRDEALAIVNHTATQVFYALAGGVLFWIALYYICIDRRQTDKREMAVYLLIFGVGASISWVVGYFY
jgi:hypothetical protein